MFQDSIQENWKEKKDSYKHVFAQERYKKTDLRGEIGERAVSPEGERCRRELSSGGWGY